MARATVQDVRDILPADTSLTDEQIQAAIDAATCVVDAMAAGCASHLSEECLTQVEIYLAAHIAANTENTLSKKSEKDACTGSSVTYGFQFGEGYAGTPYGQTANLLSNGCLAEMEKQPVSFHSIGTHGGSVQ